MAVVCIGSDGWVAADRKVSAFFECRVGTGLRGCAMRPQRADLKVSALLSTHAATMVP